MTLRTFTIEEKLEIVERMIEVGRLHRSAPGTEAYQQVEILKAIASDLRARLEHVPSATLVDLERRIVAVARTKGPTGYQPHALHELGTGVTVRWPVIRAALELFGAKMEEEAA